MKQLFILLIITLWSNNVLTQQANTSWCSYNDKYALIIMGGSQAPSTNLYGWYWGDCYRMYNRLINNFSFSPSNIRLLSYGDSATVHSSEVYDISTISNVEQAYQWLAQVSTQDDLCYIFWVDHGSPTNFLLNDGNISHTIIGTLTKAINARCVAGAYNPCNSGAIVDDVSANNVITVTSVLPTELNSFGWAGAWTTGVTGGGTNDPSDFNGDGHVSFAEMFEWISPKAIQYGEHCTYDDNGDGIYALFNTSTYNPTVVGLDGFFGKDYSLSGWNCPNAGIMDNNRAINLYPNPTKENLFIDITGYSGRIKVEIRNIQGKLIETKKSNNISLENYSKGIYILHIFFKEDIGIIKIIKE